MSACFALCELVLAKLACLGDGVCFVCHEIWAVDATVLSGGAMMAIASTCAHRAAIADPTAAR